MSKTRNPNPQPPIKFTNLLINNEWVDSVSGRKFPTENPATGKVIVEVSEADKADVDKAVAAARRAFMRGSAWRSMKASARGRLIMKLADLIEENVDELASLESLDNGKRFNDAYDQVLYSLEFLRYLAGCSDKIHGRTMPTDEGMLAMTIKEPVGVVGTVIPWNYPIVMIALKLGHALAAGCTLVMKPAEQTPLTALYVGNLIIQAGFPPGVVNIVPGYGPTAGAALSEHPDVDKLSFTGSLPVGRAILTAAANSNLKHVSLELGGKSPLVVFDDADLDAALMYSYMGIFTNAGQTCIAPSRIYVQAGIHDKFLQKFVQMTSQVKVGGPFEKDVFQGPQIDTEIFERVMSLIDSGIKEGAKLEIGGKRHGNEGYFVQPTVFSNVRENMRISKEEIFGPVQCIFKFETLEEVIQRANDTTYGLAAGVFTHNLENALVFAKAVQSGSVWINQWSAAAPELPFGGYKLSGVGREMGIDSLDDYLNVKTIGVKLPTSF